MYQIVPNNSTTTMKFITNLLQQNIGLLNGNAKHIYKDNHKPVTVLTSDNDYPENECWFNCLDYSINHGCKPVFGWAIWDIAPNTFVAQHHAVVDINGGLLDVTLNKSFDSILFVPDQNAPFDFNDVKIPFNFKQSPKGSYWFADKHESQFFQSGRCNVSIRAKNIILRGQNAGVI